MDRLVTDFTGRVAGLHWSLLGAWLLLLFVSIGQAVRLLAGEAAGLAARWKTAARVPGALACAAPAALVCALASWRRDYGLSLGVAVGTFNCGLGVVLALACLASARGPGRAPAASGPGLRRRGWAQAAAGLLLCALALASRRGLPAWSGALLLGLTAGHLRLSSGRDDERVPARGGWAGAALTAALAAALLAASSLLLFPAAQQAAWVAGVRTDVVASTLVAFGLCAPRALDCAAALSRGKEGPALDQVLDDNLVVLLLAAGAACAASGGWLVVGDSFLRVHLPIMGGLLLLCQAYFLAWRETLRRPLGMTLLGFYAAYAAVQYWLK